MIPNYAFFDYVPNFEDLREGRGAYWGWGLSFRLSVLTDGYSLGTQSLISIDKKCKITQQHKKVPNKITFLLTE